MEMESLSFAVIESNNGIDFFNLGENFEKIELKLFSVKAIKTLKNAVRN